MKKNKFCSVLIFPVIVLFSCVSSVKISTDTIVRGTGVVIGTVTASASVSENRETGETTGDTLKYGYLITWNEKDNSQVNRLASHALTNATETAYANALYEIIQQAKAMGGNALNEVASVNKRNYDLSAETETVTVTITAQVIILQ